VFNSYYTSNPVNLNLNAVNGTLVKNHPKSIFVTTNKDSSLFSHNPQWRFLVYDSRSYNNVSLVEEEAVVLQAMIIAQETFLCEIVRKKDFEESLNIGNENKNLD
jgi:hypothetical protein